jgi:hypothetical protein
MDSHKQGLPELASVCILCLAALEKSGSPQAEPVSARIPDNLALLVAFTSRSAIKAAAGTSLLPAKGAKNERAW